MKTCSRIYRVLFFLLIACAPALASDADEFTLLHKYFVEKNYAMVKNTARDLIDKPRYRFRVKLLLAETYYQENDLIYAKQLLKELADEYPDKEAEILKRVEKIDRDISFTTRGSADRDRRFNIFWGEKTSGDRKMLTAIAAIFDDAYSDGGKFFGWYPDALVNVLVYYGDEYAKYTVLPPWSGGAYDGKIRIMVHGGIDKEKLKELIYHEYAHVIIYGMTGGNCPLWLNEAAAQYFALRYVHGGQPRPSGTESLRRPESFPENWSGMPGDRVKTLYDSSLALLVHITGRTSEYTLIDILQNLGRGDRFPAALDRALSPYGFTGSDLFN